MYRFFKQKVTHQRLSATMYAILKTKARLSDSFSIGLQEFNRKQAKGFTVDVVIDIAEDKIAEFERLAGVGLKTSEEYQGRIRLNSHHVARPCQYHALTGQPEKEHNK